MIDRQEVAREITDDKDRRYSIALEYCGYAKRRWIVRYCGEWVGMGKNRADADTIARQHKAARIVALSS